MQLPALRANIISLAQTNVMRVEVLIRVAHTKSAKIRANFVHLCRICELIVIMVCTPADSLNSHYDVITWSMTAVSVLVNTPTRYLELAASLF